MNRILKYLSAAVVSLVCIVLSAVLLLADGTYKTPATNDYMVYVFIILAIVAFIGILAAVITMIDRRNKKD